jgi:hypothetical protein
MCYCNIHSNEEILEDIVDETVPDEALVNNCCWRRICRARGLQTWRVDNEKWRQLCARRGYLFSRQNPRGF